MNQLEYTLIINDIKHTYTVGKLEACIRKYLVLCDDLKWRNSILTDFVKLKLGYKVLTLALNTFATKSKRTLPDFIYSDYTRISKSISEVIYELTYDELIDTLEFHTEFTVSANSDLTTQYHNTIKNKPLHFTLNINSRNSVFDQYSLITDEINALVRTFRNKLVLAPNQPSTVLDKELTLAKFEFDIPTDTTNLLQQMDESRIQLEQQLAALEATKQYIITQGQ